LLAEAGLYRYDDSGSAETPVDEDNHALAALRYLVSTLDVRQMARPGAGPRDAAGPPDQPADAPPPAPPRRRPWLRLDNEDLWTTL
jgi:hypothetical protein